MEFKKIDNCRIGDAGKELKGTHCAKGYKVCKGSACSGYAGPVADREAARVKSELATLKAQRDALDKNIKALEPEPDKDAEKPLDKMNKTELIAKAAELGIQLIMNDEGVKATKAELITMIQEKLTK